MPPAASREEIMDGAPSTPLEAEVRLEPQTIPPPRAASPEARAYLATPFWAGERARLDPDDVAGWQAAIANVDQMYAPMLQAALADARADVEKVSLGGVTVYIATPHGLDPARQGLAHLYI